MSEEEEGSLSLVLFSGTDDKLASAAILAVGAAAMGRRVHVFLQFWALAAFRADWIRKDHGVAPEAGPEGQAMVQGHSSPHWSETLAQAKEIGEVSIHACSHSMELLGIEQADLDPLVDGVEGVASFFAEATGGVTFI